MKTITIKELKKEVLVVEITEETQFEVLVNSSLWKDGIKFISENDEFNFVRGNYAIIGKVDDIKEEAIEELVDTFDFNYYTDYNHPTRAYTDTALQSFNSALEKHLFWVNPYDVSGETFSNETKNKWQEAQEKTFDRNRTLIFVKN